MTAPAPSAPVSSAKKPSRYFPSPQRTPGGASANQRGVPRVEAETLFQKYFKSVGPRTYAAQVKKAGNGNHFLVLTEGKRDAITDEVRKTRLFVFSEDFQQFRELLRDTFKWIADHPVPDDVKKRQADRWKKNQSPPRPRDATKN